MFDEMREGRSSFVVAMGENPSRYPFFIGKRLENHGFT